MTFTAEQIEKLEAPLLKSRVSQREGGHGMKLDYLEGWDVIDHANHVFGFGAWDRETTEMTELWKGVRSTRNGEKHVVSFRARVRVTVYAGERRIVREGTGFGDGSGRDLGEAYELATKESETDAMKRAFMTFGNGFGLALYDKSRESVFDDKRAPEKVHVGSSKDVRGRKVYEILLSEMTAVRASTALRAWGENHKTKVNELPPDWREEFKAAYKQRLLDLTHGEKAADPDPTYQLLLETMEKTRDLSSFERDWADEIASLPDNLQTAIADRLDRARIK